MGNMTKPRVDPFSSEELKFYKDIGGVHWEIRKPVYSKEKRSKYDIGDLLVDNMSEGCWGIGIILSKEFYLEENEWVRFDHKENLSREVVASKEWRYLVKFSNSECTVFLYEKNLKRLIDAGDFKVVRTKNDKKR